MNTAVINIKTAPEVKSQAQKVAAKLGFSLSALINGYLRHLIKVKTVYFYLKEEPSPYLIAALKESDKVIKAGRESPTFNNVDNALAWLDDNERKYVTDIQQKVCQTKR